MNNLSVNDRMKNVIINDKQENLDKIERVLKSEFLNLLRNYFEIVSDDINIELSINSDGKYDLQVSIVSRAIRFARVF